MLVLNSVNVLADFVKDCLTSYLKWKNSEKLLSARYNGFMDLQHNLQVVSFQGKSRPLLLRPQF